MNIFKKYIYYILVGVLLLVGGMASAERTTVFIPGVQVIPVTGTCYDNNNGVASTTLFAVNPFFGIATSTVTFASLTGVNGATTTDVAVGTSTIVSISPTKTNIDSVGANLFTIPGVSTTTQFVFVTGNTRNGYGQATTSTATGIPFLNADVVVVGPNEKLVGYATSTYAGKGNGGKTTGTVPTLTSCTYKMIFTM